MKIIDDNLINSVMEPGTFIPVHHHPTKAETFVILKGKVRTSIKQNRLR